MASNMTDFYETWNLSLLSSKDHIKTAKLNLAKLNSTKLNLTKLNLAKLHSAKLNSAKLNLAKLNSAELISAKLISVKPNLANLNMVKLNLAKLNLAKLKSIHSLKKKNPGLCNIKKPNHQNKTPRVIQAKLSLFIYYFIILYGEVNIMISLMLINNNTIDETLLWMQTWKAAVSSEL